MRSWGTGSWFGSVSGAGRDGFQPCPVFNGSPTIQYEPKAYIEGTNVSPPCYRPVAGLFLPFLFWANAQNKSGGPPLRHRLIYRPSPHGWSIAASNGVLRRTACSTLLCPPPKHVQQAGHRRSGASTQKRDCIRDRREGRIARRSSSPSLEIQPSPSVLGLNALCRDVKLTPRRERLRNFTGETTRIVFC